jgi:hypothetical protein
LQDEFKNTELGCSQRSCFLTIFYDELTDITKVRALLLLRTYMELGLCRHGGHFLRRKLRCSGGTDLTGNAKDYKDK